jgi:hypothetical protein
MGSGAKILVLDDVVIKTNGGDLVNSQARWLQRYASPGVVQVRGEWHNGYVMERLDVADPAPEPQDVIDLLARYVWPNTHGTLVVWDDIVGYAELRARQWWEDVYVLIRRRLHGLRKTDLRTVLTHGDPTFENVMMRVCDYVLIDPIPSKPTSPNLMALDLGKIVQSCCGYEAASRGMVPGTPDVTWLESFSAVEQDAALTFALYHVLRLLPYLNSQQERDHMKATVGANVMGLCV